MSFRNEKILNKTDIILDVECKHTLFYIRGEEVPEIDGRNDRVLLQYFYTLNTHESYLYSIPRPTVLPTQYIIYTLNQMNYW